MRNMRKIQKINNLLKTFKISTSNRSNFNGVTLIELSVSLAVFSLFAYFAITFVTQMQENFAGLQNKVEGQQALNQITYTLKSFFSMATELRQGDNKVLAVSNAGFVDSFKSETLWKKQTGNGELAHVAAFLQMNQRGGNVVAINNQIATETFMPTLVSFQSPTIDKTGVLYFNRGRGGLPLNATREGLFYSGIVQFDVIDIDSSDYIVRDLKNGAIIETKKMVSSVTFDFVVRYYYGGRIESRATWCPPAHMKEPECLTSRVYRDYRRRVTVFARNNVIGESPSQRYLAGNDLVGGLVQTVLLPLPMRPFKSVYFFKTDIP